MEARDDLRKFITEFTVAPVVAVLSSGRGADSGAGGTSQRRGGTGQHREIVGRLTPWAGIESSMAMGSDQTAAEALQEAETEVGVVVKALIGVRVAGLPGPVVLLRRSADPSTGFDLTA